jgi:hypothetical protein
MTYSKKFLAVAVAATTLVSVPAASAQPAPYERDHMSPQRVAKIVRHARMIPRPGADGTNRLCASPSKARRIACR